MKESSQLMCLSLSVVTSLMALVGSIAYMSGGYFSQIDNNIIKNKELRESLDKIAQENKRLWESVLINKINADAQNRHNALDGIDSK